MNSPPFRPLCASCQKPLRLFPFRDTDWAKKRGLMYGYKGEGVFCRLICGYRYGLLVAQIARRDFPVLSVTKPGAWFPMRNPIDNTWSVGRYTNGATSTQATKRGGLEMMTSARSSDWLFFLSEKDALDAIAAKTGKGD